MMYEKAKEIVEEIKEVREIFMKAVMEDTAICDIDVNTFMAFRHYMNLLDKSCDYMLEQAVMIEGMNNKLDDLLVIARKGS